MDDLPGELNIGWVGGKCLGTFDCSASTFTSTPAIVESGIVGVTGGRRGASRINSSCTVSWTAARPPRQEDPCRRSN